ncbi:hypothetical protein [Streptomyces sp. NPDC057909]
MERNHVAGHRVGLFVLAGLLSENGAGWAYNWTDDTEEFELPATEQNTLK